MCYLLILDDDVLFCNTLKDVLTRPQSTSGFIVEVCQDVSDAIDKVNAAIKNGRPFDVMLIDQHLSFDLDGIQVLKELRQISPELDAIIFTGLGDIESGARAYSAGAFRYLQKPFPVKELMFEIQSLLEWRKVQSERNRLRVLNEIGRRVTRRATLDDLSILLEEVREQVGQLMDVSNFLIALVDEGINKLDFRLHYERNEQQERHFLPKNEGMTWHLIERNQTLYLPTGDETYRAEHGIHPHGRPAQCWVGIPLRTENRVIGAIVLQSYDRPSAFSKLDVELLQAVADQISGAIQASFNAEAERQNAKVLANLPYVSTVLMNLANQNEDQMWYTLLTFATADYGFGFNRAWLFLIDPLHTRLHGRRGIGNIDEHAAHLDWENDVREKMTFEKFMRKLLSGGIEYTPIENLVQKIVVDPNVDRSQLSEVFKTGVRRVLSKAESLTLLPPDFVQLFDPADCAVLPVRASEENVGIMVVDNKHNGKVIDEVSLDRLETFLNMAGLIGDNLHHRKSYEAMVGATSAIMGEVSDRPLKDTLARVCSAASRILTADWVVVYPLKPGTGSRGLKPLEYDLPNIGSSGTLYQATRKEKPRPQGTSAHILNGGKLVVQDIEQKDHATAGLNLKKHPFFIKTGVKAFIGIPIRDVLSREELGVMYLDYLMPRKFSDQDIHQAELFANLAAIAMRNARQAEDRKIEMAQAHQRGQAGERELAIYQGILREALTYSAESAVARAVNNAVLELLSMAHIHALLLLYEVRTDEDGASCANLYYYSQNGDKIQVKDGDHRFSQDVAKGAIHEGKTFAAADGLQAYIPVRMGDRNLGLVFVNSRKEPIGEDQISALERLSSVTAQALDNIHRQNHLRGLLQAAKAVLQPIGLQETLDAIVRSVREAVPELSAITLWYLDPEDEILKLGPSFGVAHEGEMIQSRWGDGSIMNGAVIPAVMNSPEPIYAENVRENKHLAKRFVFDEDIQSVAALPLVADFRKVGSMFLNYRHHHYFSHEEKLLFPLLAEIVAACISDAIALESEKRQRKRLDAALAVARAVGASLDINQIIHAVLEELHSLMSNTQTIPCLFIYNEEEDALEFAPTSREFYKIDNPERMDMKMLALDGPSLACKVAAQSMREKRQVKMREEDVLNNPDYLNLRSSTRSELCIGLVGNEDLLGVLVLESDQPGAFGEDEEILIEGVAQQISLALERSRQSDVLSFTSTVAASYSWAAEMAHDINREVGIILNNADWICDEVEDHRQVCEYAQKIKASASLLGTIGPWGQKEPEPIKLDPEIYKIFQRLGKRLAEPIEFKFDLGCDGYYVKVSRSILERVLRHLVRNASEQMQAERVVRIYTRPCNDTTIEITVVDSGPGIDETVYPVLFKKPVTTRLDSLKSGQGGSGLLFVRHMVEQMMNGKIRALPPCNNQGAAFEIRLPAYQE